jgi:hypothetical protein
MAKIDFIKVEQNLGQALQYWFVKKLTKGERADYPNTISFYGSTRAKPVPQDSVIIALKEWEQEQREEEMAEKDNLQPKEVESKKEEPTPSLPNLDTDTETIFQPATAPKVAPLFILRKRLLWFIRNRVVNIYKLLGTTKEEMVELRKKKPLTAEDEKRILELLKTSAEIHGRLMKKLGIDSDEALVASEKKRHLTKRFNIRETWLPL